MLLGGQRTLGVAVQLTLGGICGIPFMLVIVIPPVPLLEPGESEFRSACRWMPPAAPLNVVFHVHQNSGGENGFPFASTPTSEVVNPLKLPGGGLLEAGTPGSAPAGLSKNASDPDV